MALERKEALELLLKQRAGLIGHANSILRDFHAAEDVFQEVSLLVVEKCALIRDQKAFPAWTHTAIRFKALKKLKTRREIPMDDEILESLQEYWIDASVAQPAEKALKALEQCLGKLSKRSQELVRMRFKENNSCRSIAEKLERPPNTIYVTFSRLYKQLAECVGNAVKNEGLEDVAG